MPTSTQNDHHTIPRFLAKEFPVIKKLSNSSTIRVDSQRHDCFNALFIERSPCEVVDLVYRWAEQPHFYREWKEHRREKKTKAFIQLFGLEPGCLHRSGNVNTVIHMLEEEFLPDKDIWETAVKQLRAAGIDQYKLWWA